MNSVFYDGWQGLARVAIIGVCAYAALVFFLRISGKRTLSKMNAFDLVVTVALGSTLATILLSDKVALAEGILALVLLIGLQFVITWASTRSEAFQKIIKAQPRMVFYQGEFLDEALRLERVTREEILAAIRAQGQSDLSQIYSVVLETDGSFSVLSQAPTASDSTLDNVLQPPQAKQRPDGQRPIRK